MLLLEAVEMKFGGNEFKCQNSARLCLMMLITRYVAQGERH